MKRIVINNTTKLVSRNFVEWDGFRYARNDCSILASMSSILNPGEELSDEQFGKLYDATAKFLDAISQNAEKEIQSSDPLIWRKGRKTPRVLYKYVTADTYDNFIKRGCLRLGSVQYYRRVENIGIRDEREGFAFVNITGNLQEIFVSVLSGLDHAILCMTTQAVPDPRLQRQFGDVVLRIDDVPGLIAAIATIIDARRVVGQKVEYADRKHIRHKAKVPSYDFHCLRNSREFTELVFEIFRQAVFFPSIFVKPLSYRHELEFRLAFDIGRDVGNGILDIQHPSLAAFFRPL